MEWKASKRRLVRIRKKSIFSNILQSTKKINHLHCVFYCSLQMAELKVSVTCQEWRRMCQENRLLKCIIRLFPFKTFHKKKPCQHFSIKWCRVFCERAQMTLVCDIKPKREQLSIFSVSSILLFTCYNYKQILMKIFAQYLWGGIFSELP